MKTDRTSLIVTMFQGWRGCVGSVPVPNQWSEESVWRILQRVQGGIPKVGTLHRRCPCPTPWIGKKLVSTPVLTHTVLSMMFCKSKSYQATSGRQKLIFSSKWLYAPVFLSASASQKERWVGRGGVMRAQGREVEMGGLGYCRGGKCKSWHDTKR